MARLNIFGNHRVNRAPITHSVFGRPGRKKGDEVPFEVVSGQRSAAVVGDAGQAPPYNEVKQYKSNRFSITVLPTMDENGKKKLEIRGLKMSEKHLSYILDENRMPTAMYNIDSVQCDAIITSYQQEFDELIKGGNRLISFSGFNQGTQGELAKQFAMKGFQVDAATMQHLYQKDQQWLLNFYEKHSDLFDTRLYDKQQHEGAQRNPMSDLSRLLPQGMMPGAGS